MASQSSTIPRADSRRQLAAPSDEGESTTKAGVARSRSDFQQLWQHFDTLADTLNSVTNLRQLVFEMALQGRLVNQESRDESAEILVRRLTEQKAELLRK